MKTSFILALLVPLVASIPLAANAQLVPSPKHYRPPSKAKVADVGGVETIKPQEAPSNEPEKGSGWNGAYVGVNAGRGFGTSAGTSLMFPVGSSSQPSK